MEDALALPYQPEATVEQTTGLNPCCNGRCTRTQVVSEEELEKLNVLILVVMEDALARPCLAISPRPTCVLILVVMEDALAQLMF